MIRETNYSEIKKIFEEDMNETPFRKYYIYEEENNALGYFIIDIIYERIEIVNIFVLENQRNRNIGTNMLKYLIEFGKSNNFYNITLEVREDNINAIKLYTKFGFINKAKRIGYYNGVDGILMELVL